MSEYFFDRAKITEEIKHLIRTNNFEKIYNCIFFAKVIMIYFFIYFVFYCNYWMYNKYGVRALYLLPVFIVMIGCLQYIIAQASHEAIHFHIKYKNTFYSILCTFLILYPIGVTKNYKNSHALHHIHFGDKERDPDYLTFMTPPCSKMKFWLMLVKSFLGISTAKRVLNLFRYRRKSVNQRDTTIMKQAVELFKLMSVQGILFLILMKMGIGWSYFVLWILPLALITKSLIDIRLLAEHSPMENTEPALRSFMKKDWSNSLLGVFGFKFHAEHHLYPGIPYYNLHKVSPIIKKHAMCMRGSEHDYKIELSELSYFHFLKKYYHSLPGKFEKRISND